jgi:hypothetical protein
MTLGVAVVGAVAGASVSGALGAGFATATHPGWWIIACLGAAVIVLGAVTTTPWARLTARRTAERLRQREPGDSTHAGMPASRPRRREAVPG